MLNFRSLRTTILPAWISGRISHDRHERQVRTRAFRSSDCRGASDSRTAATITTPTACSAISCSTATRGSRSRRSLAWSASAGLRLRVRKASLPRRRFRRRTTAGPAGPTASCCRATPAPSPSSFRPMPTPRATTSSTSSSAPGACACPRRPCITSARSMASTVPRSLASVVHDQCWLPGGRVADLPDSAISRASPSCGGTRPFCGRGAVWLRQGQSGSEAAVFPTRPLANDRLAGGVALQRGGRPG